MSDGYFLEIRKSKAYQHWDQLIEETGAYLQCHRLIQAAILINTVYSVNLAKVHVTLRTDVDRLSYKRF
jgi:hypothetical protein